MKYTIPNPKPEYLDWNYDITYETAQAISLVFGITFGEACKYGLDDMSDEDYDAVMEIRRKICAGEIHYDSTEALPYI